MVCLRLTDSTSASVTDVSMAAPKKTTRKAAPKAKPAEETAPEAEAPAEDAE